MKKLLFISIFIILISVTTGCQNNNNINTTKTPVIQTNDSENITTTSSEWQLMDNPDNSIYSTNYEAANKKDNEEYKQIITVFSNQMTEDRKVGELISQNEYIEAFPGITPNTITIQIRVNKDTYWLMSRQTFKSKNDYSGQFSISYDTLINVENLQNDIDNTRYILNNEF